MIEELLQEITQTEKREDARVAESVIAAKAIVEKARIKSVEIEADTERELDRLAAENTASANKHADKLVADIAERTEKEIADIASYADSQAGVVISDIIGRIEKKYA